VVLVVVVVVVRGATVVAGVALGSGGIVVVGAADAVGALPEGEGTALLDAVGAGSAPEQAAATTASATSPLSR